MQTPITKPRKNALLLLAICSGISVLWGYYLQQTSPGGMPDFRAIYYGARCILHHRDPYLPADFLSVYQQDGGEFPTRPDWYRNFRRAVPYCINLPTTLVYSLPLAMLPWWPAHLLWTLILAVCLFLGVVLAWDLGADYSPGISLFLASFLAINCEVMFELGNAAGIAVGLCMVAVWCFHRQRLPWLGVLCLAIPLAIKPQDVAFIWLYFLLAGGDLRKRALQSMAVTALFSLVAVLWIYHLAPHWMQEIQANIAATSARGDLNDPGPASIGNTGLGMMISLQTVISVFKDDPDFYNMLTHLLFLPVLGVWAVVTLRTRTSEKAVWCALAATAALSLLPIYHRQYDAKILLLAIPACAFLWRQGGVARWLALAVTGMGFVFTADLPLGILRLFTQQLPLSPVSFHDKWMTVAIGRLAPLSVLLMGIFYLWLYVRQSRTIHQQGEKGIEVVVPGNSNPTASQ